MNANAILVELVNHRIPREDSLSADVVAELYPAAKRQGLVILVAAALKDLGPDLALPDRIQDEFAQAARQAAAKELVLGDERIAVLDLLARFRPLALKGTALSWLYYPAPHLRPMADMDLLIAPQDVGAVKDVLTRAGFTVPAVIEADLVMNQFMARKPLQGGLNLELDIHTRLFNRPALAETLTYPELQASAVPLLALGDNARAPGTVHLLVHACLHLLAHHMTDRRMVWLYDISLILGRLDEVEAAELLTFCREKGLARVFDHLIRECLALFPTSCEPVLAGLAEQLQSGECEFHPATGMLQTRSRRERNWQDWKSLEGFSDRGRWLRQNLFPDSGYMMQRYHIRNRWLLPGYYLWRIGRGSVRLFRTKG